MSNTNDYFETTDCVQPEQLHKPTLPNGSGPTPEFDMVRMFDNGSTLHLPKQGLTSEFNTD